MRLSKRAHTSQPSVRPFCARWSGIRERLKRLRSSIVLGATAAKPEKSDRNRPRLPSRFMSTKAFPLDLAQVSYSYVERANPAIQHLVAKHTLSMRPKARVLDVGCGCGANAQAIRERCPGAWVLGVEPNARAAQLARELCNDVFQGTTDDWQKSGPHDTPFDAVVL